MKAKLPIQDLENIHKEEDELEDNNVQSLRKPSKMREKAVSMKDIGNNNEKNKKTMAKSTFFRGKSNVEANNIDEEDNS